MILLHFLSHKVNNFDLYNYNCQHLKYVQF